MNEERKVVYIKEEELEKYQSLMELDSEKAKKKIEEIGKYKTIKTYIVKFLDEVEGEVRILTDHNSFIVDAELFNEFGDGLFLLDPRKTLLGEYVLEYKGNRYIVEIALESERSDKVKEKEKQETEQKDEKELFLMCLTSFYEAANALSENWVHGYEFDQHYPFDYDFEEMVCQLLDWKLNIKEEINKQK